MRILPHWRQWLGQLGIALDQLANVLITPFSGAAWADETLSSRSWRMWEKRRPWGYITRPLIDGLFYFFQGAGHCQTAYKSEQARMHSPPEHRLPVNL